MERVSNILPVKILIIDDEALDLFIAKKQLGFEFSDVTGFTSYREAIDWCKTNRPDIVHIDYYLEGHVTGAHVLKELLEIEGLTFIPYLLTNHVDADQVKSLKEQGFRDVIFKPLTVESFKEVVNR